MRVLPTLVTKRLYKFLFISRRKFNWCLLTLIAILVFGYIIVMDILQEPDHSIHIAEMTMNRMIADPESGAQFVESYCKQRESEERQASLGVKNVGFIHSPRRTDKDQVCIHPHMDPCDPEVAFYDRSVEKVNCSGEENWVFVENGTFRISGSAIERFGKITCEYAPIVRGRGDYSARHSEHIKPMLDGSPLVSDFFKVACISSTGKRYHNIHAGVAYDEKLHRRSQETALPPRALGYDVFMFVFFGTGDPELVNRFDSTSRMSWIRNLPKTREFFLQTLNGLELEGYNIVGDGTVQALLPILTGHTEHDLPTVRRGEPGATEVDNFPWIWKLFKKAGYVSAWAEDLSYIGTFQMRLKGFLEQPTDHCMRTYFMLAEPMYHKFSPWCVGSEPRHSRFLNWFRDMYHMYNRKPKFMFGFHSEYSHDNNSQLKKVDEDLFNLLKYLHSNGYLDHTVLILMGDHGARFTDARSTAQGKLEERMPYFAFHFPPRFFRLHPRAAANFKTNINRLTTPFDIHETFHDILSFQEHHVDHTKNRGISLFKEVPLNRTCESSGIEPHWCACLKWVDVKNKSIMMMMAHAVVNFINNLTSHVRVLCARLELHRIVSLSRFSPNSEVLMYKQSSDIHGDHPDLTDNMTLGYDYYQAKLITRPGNSQFEATVKHSTITKDIFVSEKSISRTNQYGSRPSCITDKFPNLRPYCFCK